MERIKLAAEWLWGRIKEEPVLVTATVLMVSNAAAYFGLDVPAEALGAFDAVAVPVLAMLTRKQVTPVAKLGPMTVPEFVELYGEGLFDLSMPENPEDLPA